MIFTLPDTKFIISLRFAYDHCARLVLAFVIVHNAKILFGINSKGWTPEEIVGFIFGYISTRIVVDFFNIKLG